MGKTALITGSAKRVGKAAAVRLASKGYDIAGVYHSGRDGALLLKNEIESMGKKCCIYRCNLEDAVETASLLERAASDFLSLDLLLNNASLFKRAKIKETDDRLLDEIFSVNFRAPFILTREFSRYCKQGSIINLLDTKIAKNGSVYSAYTLSKQALYHLTLQAANEFAPHIRVNGIAPGVILPLESMPAKTMDRIIKKNPLGKTGDIKHFLQALDYLVENDYVTGQVLYIDGGHHL